MKTYDPQEVQVVVNNVVLTGFAEGTFVQCEQLEDNFSEYVGAQGEVSVAETSNKTGEITVTLQQTSPSNSHLSKLANGKTSVPVQVIDLNGQGFKAGGNECRIRKPAGIERSNEITTREWVIFVGDYTQTE